MALAAQYGTTSPAAIDPFQIESTLAQIVGQANPQEAANMLDTYQIQRATSEGNYNYALQGQHEFAKQQLAQQLYEANLKGLAEAKDPTVLSIMANAPGYQQVFGGAGAPAIGDALARAQAAQGAKNFEAAGKGAEGFSNAGYMVNAGDIPGIPAGAGVVQTENARLAAERLRANAILGAASIRAAGGGASGEPTTSVQVTDPNTGLPMTLHYGSKVSPQQVQTSLRNRGVPVTDASAPPTPLPNTSSNTSLPMAKTDTPANRPSNAPANTTAGAAQLQQQVLANLDKIRTNAPSKFADLKAGMDANGGRPIVKAGPDGKPAVYGASGNPL
jgi:hypothetical protein